MVPENQALYSRTDAANGHLRRYHRDEVVRLFRPCTPETLFDYGFPFMRMYLNVLGRVHDTVVPVARPAGLKRAALRVASAALTGLFQIDLLFPGWFRGSGSVAVSPNPSPR